MTTVEQRMTETMRVVKPPGLNRQSSVDDDEEEFVVVVVVVVELEVPVDELEGGACCCFSFEEIFEECDSC